MIDSLSPRIITLFSTALDMQAAEREAWLARLNTTDADLLPTLRRLLDLDACALLPLDRVIDQAAAALPQPDDNTGAERRYGAWRLLEKLGRGGMGSVWLAERVEGGFNQRAALKLLHLGMDNEPARARFRRERDMLARLTHPDIAHLLDGGIDDDGQPWFAMESIDGCTLDEWIAHGLVDSRTRLRLFARLARAVGFAHRHLIVHRDIKPSNVMVRSDGSPCLLDFGIAKLVEGNDVEALTAHPLLTPAYAAPEQLRGETATTSADIYALGAVLHELASGRRFLQPQRDASGGRSVKVRLDHDLDAIVQRATAADPTRRYASAEALAEDVERYLDGRAVSARPDSNAYRFRKLVTRNRVASAVVSVCLIAFIAAGITAFWLARAKAAEADRARMALRQSEAVRGFIMALLSNADPFNAHGAATPIGDLLAPARQRVIEQLSGEPAIAAELLDEIGSIHVSLGQADEARRALNEALAFNARAPQPSLAIEGEATARLAHYQYMDGHSSEALTKLVAIIARMRGHPEVSVRQQLAKALELEAQVLHALGRSTQALVAEREAVDILRAMGATHATEYLSMLIGYADLCAGTGQASAALAAADEAMADAAVRGGRAPGLTAEAMGARARALQALGRVAEAEPQTAEVIARFTRIYGERSGRTYYWRYRHAQLLQQLGRLNAAQTEVDALIAAPAVDDQPVAPIAYAVLGADLARARHAPDAARRIATARSAACGKPDFAPFCDRARALRAD